MNHNIFPHSGSTTILNKANSCSWKFLWIAACKTNSFYLIITLLIYYGKSKHMSILHRQNPGFIGSILFIQWKITKMLQSFFGAFLSCNTPTLHIWSRTYADCWKYTQTRLPYPYPTSDLSLEVDNTINHNMKEKTKTEA